MNQFYRGFLVFLAIQCVFGANAMRQADWGFFGHKTINRLAVFALPEEMYPFFRFHIQELSLLSVKPDQRRYVVKEEGERHFIDIDAYPDSILQAWQEDPFYADSLPQQWLHDHGALPRQVLIHKRLLTTAMLKGESASVLRLAAELGHYIGDAHVPLHTTQNYDGQLTGQRGIHGLWESRLPELHLAQYELFTDKARYLENPGEAIWKAIFESNAAVDSVLAVEQELARAVDQQIMSHDIRRLQTMRQYSTEFADAYEKAMNGMVERRMRASIQLTADFWYTCWVDAGMPVMANEELINPGHMMDEWDDSLRVITPRNVLHH
ncbi:zinc dependent phospholipase C family protein [Fulvivirga sedimenti]|uniref:Zinc dependent phospholipase C family protein n=1 Tax=Fulvivirga sedimenti TaxID=2879465 RepID=A0A9X1L0K6_9BACT|nr:zinc dependent phospholipase C family protein [Fulvivirga sedimenti]MCA6077929.1 zinc dependent phospholipase C family protein [Fulvivirga sedimenti]